LLVQFSERFPYLCRRRRRLASLSMTDVLLALCCSVCDRVCHVVSLTSVRASVLFVKSCVRWGGRKVRIRSYGWMTSPRYARLCLPSEIVILSLREAKNHQTHNVEVVCLFPHPTKEDDDDVDRQHHHHHHHPLSSGVRRHIYNRQALSGCHEFSPHIPLFFFSFVSTV
jgi:hypothetical protein